MLITIEGIDGSGKATQAKLVQKNLEESGLRSTIFSFPAYQSSAYGDLIAEYLNGNLGKLEDIHPKLAALMFSVDRLHAKEQLDALLDEGGIVICDRYVHSNIAYQSARVPEDEQTDFSNWLYDLEFKTNDMPKPDAAFFLNVAPDVARERVLQKDPRDYTDKAEDLHEQEHGYMETVSHRYLCLPELIPIVEADTQKDTASMITKIIIDRHIDRLKFLWD